MNLNHYVCCCVIGAFGLNKKVSCEELLSGGGDKAF